MSDTAIDSKGRELKLGGMANDCGPGRNPRCCTKARYILNHKGGGPMSANPGPYACVCYGISYCPDHGTQCNGSHD